MAAWALLFLFRKVGFEHVTWAELNNSLPDANLWRGLVIVPLGWITLYTLQGSYKNVLRKSRLKELQQTLLATLIGSALPQLLRLLPFPFLCPLWPHLHLPPAPNLITRQKSA